MKLSDQTKTKVRAILKIEIKRVQQIRADEAKRLGAARRKELKAEIRIEKEAEKKKKLRQKLAILEPVWADQGRGKKWLEIIIMRENDAEMKKELESELTSLSERIESDEEIDNRIDRFLQSIEQFSTLKLLSRQELILRRRGLKKIRKNFLELDPDTRNAFEDVLLEALHKKTFSDPSLFKLFEPGFVTQVTTELGDVIDHPELMKSMFVPPEIFLEDIINAGRGALTDALNTAIDDAKTPTEIPEVEADVYMVAILIRYYKKHTGLQVIALPGQPHNEVGSRARIFSKLLNLMYKELGIAKQADWRVRIKTAQDYLSSFDPGKKDTTAKKRKQNLKRKRMRY